MILRIYWTDKYLRQLIGKRGTTGLKGRLAKQFGVKLSTIHRIAEINHTHYHKRYPGVCLSSVQRTVKKRLRQRGILE